MKTLHQSGDVVSDRYRIVAPLGVGSSGSTYEAEDLQTYQRVALKVVSLQQVTDWKTIELFEREAKVLSHLDHPAIPNYIAHFQLDSVTDRRFYLIQELAPGRSLEERVSQGWRATEADAKQLATTLLDILCYLHGLLPPVIHRDIKPANIICCPDGRVYLVDFGAVRDVYRNTFTMGMTLVGTMGYMPPEQYQGRIRPASDLYSLGVTLLYCLTGRSPDQFPQTRLKLKFQSHVTASSNFIAWLERMLEPVLEDRFASAQDALNTLNSLEQKTNPIAPRTLHSPVQTSVGLEAWLLQFRRCENLLSIPIPSEWNPPNGVIYKPERTTIQVTRQSDRLSIQIPPLWYRPQGFFFLVFFCIWGGIPTLGVLGAIVSKFLDLLISYGAWSSLIEGFASLLMLLNPFTLIATIMISHVLTGRIYLDITPRSFSLRFRIWNWIYRRLEGNTQDIRRVEVDVETGSKGQKIYTCAVWNGTKKLRFGSMLTASEREWLVQEMAVFLNQVRSPSA